MNARKFTFDTRFDDDIPVAVATAARKKKSFSRDELEAARVTGFDEGRRTGDVRAAEALAASIGQVAAAMTQAIGAMDEEIEAMRAEAAQLAFAAAKKLAGAALAHAPEAEIADTLRAALHQAITETHITVRAPAGLVQALQQKLAELPLHEGYEGRVRFVADPDLLGADCRIEWRGGGVERAHARIEESLAELIARRFPAPSTE
jgi:flagellar assembly protein FliH